jgi:hypothetical protein
MPARFAPLPPSFSLGDLLALPAGDALLGLWLAGAASHPTPRPLTLLSGTCTTSLIISADLGALLRRVNRVALVWRGVPAVVSVRRIATERAPQPAFASVDCACGGPLRFGLTGILSHEESSCPTCWPPPSG